MQAAPNTPYQAFPLHELDQIERAIAAAQDCVAVLQVRRDALASELERITRPAPAAPRLIGPGYRYQSELVRAWSAIDIHTGLLRKLWTDRPQQRDAMARAMGARGYTRAYVARSVPQLFPGKSAAWGAKYSRPLVDDWVIDTNLNRPRIATLLRVAVAASGLTWGEEVQVYWRATRA